MSETPQQAARRGLRTSDRDQNRIPDWLEVSAGWTWRLLLLLDRRSGGAVAAVAPAGRLPAGDHRDHHLHPGRAARPGAAPPGVAPRRSRLAGRDRWPGRDHRAPGDPHPVLRRPAHPARPDPAGRLPGRAVVARDRTARVRPGPGRAAGEQPGEHGLRGWRVRGRVRRAVRRGARRRGPHRPDPGRDPAVLLRQGRRPDRPVVHRPHLPRLPPDPACRRGAGMDARSAVTCVGPPPSR